MARTKGTARNPVKPLIQGGWIQNRRGYRCKTTMHSDYRDPGGLRHITVPSYFALDQLSLLARHDVQETTSPAEASANHHVIQHHCYFLELPNEILVHIFRLLLPDSEIFHFSPAVKGRTRVISIHRLSHITAPQPGSQADQLGSLVILSSTCRRFTEVAYPVFFESNQFLFETSTTALTSSVQIPEVPMNQYFLNISSNGMLVHSGLVQTSSSHPQALQSWSRIVYTRPVGLAPLGPVAAKYLTQLTVCVILPSRSPTKYQWAQLEGSIQLIAQAFEGGYHELKSLLVDVSFGRQSGKRLLTNKLEVRATEDGLQMHINSQPQEVRQSRALIMERLRGLVEPLLLLHGVKVQVSGLVTVEMALAPNYEGVDQGTSSRLQAPMSYNES